MEKRPKVLLIDGYIDDPAALGVPPYISPMIRAVAGSAIDAGADVEYISVDMIRKGKKIPEAAVSVVLSGNTVPGKYLRSMPMSLKELDSLVPKLKGWKLIGGSAASSSVADKFDFAIVKDLAASLYDGISGKEVGERFRTLEEWNRWMLLGAGIVKQHQDYPHPLIVEMESYRGCHRYASGGCSFCIEPLKGKPLMRSPADILAEAKELHALGIRNIRIGGQTCIISYGSEPGPDPPKPNVKAITELFRGLKELDFDILHVDNANPAVISTYPDESRAVIKVLAECCTPGNVLALGMESADPLVIRSNNLNSTSSQVLDAVRIINEIGGERGENGLPRILPGLNIICGLDGETSSTYEMNSALLEQILDEGLVVRRINIRQVLPLRKEFGVKVDQRTFRTFKDSVRDKIDREMLKRVAPYGTVLRGVYMELLDGNTTFGRQIGSYPILVGVPYKLEIEKTYDVFITDWGFRSITGLSYPFNINTMPMSSIEALPGIGKKRAAKVVLGRPYKDFEEFSKAIEDPAVADGLRDIVSLD
ncbi:MAG: radical SAM protein [Candidatus Methanoplasma sp.]|jgi:radical SAM superfamily enzyme with C-terminal helix-hairpin-helix motif|nr:radical SAM protein [Candidatus Methanoplasma sp.]